MSEARPNRRSCQGSVPTSETAFQSSDGWDPVFETHRELDLLGETTPLINILAFLYDAELAETATDLAGESFVRAFMKTSLDSDACLPRADRVEALCFGASVRLLLEEKGPGNEKFVALVDERNSQEGGAAELRCIRGPFTARGLLKALSKKPRVPRAGSTALTDDPSSPTTATAIPGGPGSNVGRRLIFITDLDRWSIYALVGTASKYQAYALRTALYRHAAFETFIGVTFAPEGLHMFHLSFSLPYFALRKSVKPVDDPRRQGPNATALRRCQNITFLDWQRETTSESWYLYEAQVSCMIAGFDAWKWTGYCFLDTYFDEGHDARETVESYNDNANEEEGLEVDPFTFGNQEAGKNFNDPRRYFLEVLRIRSSQMTREWENVVSELESSVRRFSNDQDGECALSRSNDLSAKGFQQLEEEARMSRDWTVRVRRLSRALLSQLSKSVDAYENFIFGYGHCFYRSDRSDDALSIIRATLSDLQTVRSNLNSLAHQCDDFAKDLELKLIIDNIDVSNATHNISKMMRLQQLSIFLFITPIALSTQILALDRGYIPFIPQRFVSLVILVLAFFVATIGSQYLFKLLQTDRPWCRRFALALWGPKPWSKDSGSIRNLLRNSARRKPTEESHESQSTTRDENSIHDSTDQALYPGI